MSYSPVIYHKAPATNSDRGLIKQITRSSDELVYLNMLNRLTGRLVGRLLGLFIYMACASVSAQPYTVMFDILDEEDGKHAMKTTEIFEDSQGKIWFGGFDGLTAYDGFSFQNFPAQINTQGQLNANVVWSIAEDHSGKLWIGSRNFGLSYSDKAKQSFYSLDSALNTGPKPSVTIEDIVVDQQGRIWVAGDEGIHCVSEMDGILTSFPTDSFIADQQCQLHQIKPHVLLCDKENNLWMGTRVGLFILDLNEGLLHAPGVNLALPAEPIDDIQADRNGHIWVSRKSAEARLVYFKNGRTDRRREFGEIPFESDSRRIHFSFDQDNRLWAAAFSEQVYGYDFRDSTLFFQSSVNSNIPNEPFSRRPFCDSHGNIWIPSTNVIKHNYSRNFKNVSFAIEGHSITSALLVEEEYMYLALREWGVVRVHRRTGDATQFSMDESGFQQLPTNLIFSFTRLSNGHLAMVGFPWLIILDEENKRSSRHRLNGTSTGIVEDDQGFLWLGGFLGMEKRRLNGEHIKTYSLPARRGNKRNFIRRPVIDPDGNIWFGGYSSGLGKLNTATDSVTVFQPGQGNNNIPSYYITDLHLGLDGSLLIGSDLGLTVMNTENGSCRTFNHASGMQNQYVNAVLEDSNGGIWCSTNDGLVHINRHTNEIDNYNVKDGLCNSVYSPGVKFESEGQFYFGGNKGVDMFDPFMIRPSFSPPVIRLTGFKIDNKKSLSIDSVLQAEGLSLSHKNELIEIAFGATRFLSKEVIEYAYKVDGLYEDFVDLGEQRRTLLSDLPPGNYVVRLRARQKGEDWFPEQVSLPLTIRSPWWQKRGIQFLLVLLMGALIYGLIKYRERRAALKEKELSRTKELILKLEKKALLSQMNPHFLYNSMNAIQQFIAVKDNEGALKYLSAFSRFLRHVMNASNHDKISLLNEIQLVECYMALEVMRYPSKLKFSIQVQDAIDQIHTMIPPFLIQPHIERAVFRCTQNKNHPGRIKINMTSPGDHLRVLIEDNGCMHDGQNEKIAADHGHDATSISKERLKYINESIGHQVVHEQILYDDAGDVRGNQVELLINTE